jgi:replicative DNA helicase
MSKSEFDKPYFRIASVEEGVLGAILLDNHRFAEVREILSASDFALEANRQIFSVIESMLGESKVVDFATLADELRNIGKLESVGGAWYIASLCDGVVSMHAVDYAKLVKRDAKLRELASFGRWMEKAVNDGVPTEDILDQAEEKLAILKKQ